MSFLYNKTDEWGANQLYGRKVSAWHTILGLSAWQTFKICKNPVSYVMIWPWYAWWLPVPQGGGGQWEAGPGAGAAGAARRSATLRGWQVGLSAVCLSVCLSLSLSLSVCLSSCLSLSFLSLGQRDAQLRSEADRWLFFVLVLVLVNSFIQCGKLVLWFSLAFHAAATQVALLTRIRNQQSA